MPSYTLKNRKTEETKDVTCSYDDMQAMLKELGEDWFNQIGAPSIVSDTKSTLTRAGSEWQDHLKRIKSGSGRSNSIKV